MIPLEESCVIRAGPGTGKTRQLVERLNLLARIGLPPGRSVACITYTNAAADEIASRLEAGSRPMFLGTIHAFLLQYVLYPYGHWLPEVPIDFDLVTSGFARRHLQWMVHEGIIKSSKVHVPDVVAAFEAIGYGKDGSLKSFRPSGLRPAEMRAFVDRRLSEGELSQHDVLWFAWLILSNPEWAHVCEALSCRFAVILVDEFQDTTELQFEALKCIKAFGRTSLWLVGDAEQSIFGFAGASLNSYQEATQLFQTKHLSTCFRSTGRIVSFLNRFLSPEDQIVPGSDWKELPIPVYMLVGQVDDIERFQLFLKLREKHGLKGMGRTPEYLVLARGTERVRQLEAVLAGVRSGNDDFFTDLEVKHRLLCAILKDCLGTLKLQDQNNAARAFRRLDRGLSRLVLKANPGFGNPEMVGLTRDGWRQMLCLVLATLGSLDQSEIRTWTAELKKLIGESIVRTGGKKSGQKLILLGKLDMYLKKRQTYPVQEIFRQVDVSDEMPSKVRTVHRAKGMEAEAVLLVAANAAQFTRWMVPWRSAKNRDEEARIGYVGFSRAMKMLCVATDKMNAETQKLVAGWPEVEVIEL